MKSIYKLLSKEKTIKYLLLFNVLVAVLSLFAIGALVIVYNNNDIFYGGLWYRIRELMPLMFNANGVVMGLVSSFTFVYLILYRWQKILSPICLSEYKDSSPKNTKRDVLKSIGYSFLLIIFWSVLPYVIKLIINYIELDNDSYTHRDYFIKFYSARYISYMLMGFYLALMGFFFFVFNIFHVFFNWRYLLEILRFVCIAVEVVLVFIIWFIIFITWDNINY